MNLVVPFFLISLALGGDGLGSGLQIDIELNENGAPIASVDLGSSGHPQAVRRYRFLIDTGCTFSLIDESVSGEFIVPDGVDEIVEVLNGDRKALPRVLVKDLSVGGIRRTYLPAIRADLKNHPGSFQDNPVDGILGMNFLAGTRLVLDLPHQKVKWWGKLEAEYPSVPIVYDRLKVPCMTVRVQGRDFPCSIDTGAMGGLEFPLRLAPLGSGEDVSIQGAWGPPSSGKDMAIPRVGSGPFHWTWPSVNFWRSGESGLIGLDVWSAAPVCLDFVSDKVTFGTRGALGGELPLNHPGRVGLPVAWDRRSGTQATLKAVAVKPGSAMEKAGCQPGDELVRVGPLEGKALTRRSVMDWVARNEPHDWVVRRAGVLTVLHFK